MEQLVHPVQMPLGYEAEKITIPDPVRTDSTDLPDIIFILNESFCDLSDYSGIQTDRDYLGPYYDIENAVHGKAFSPNIGGGTNNTEFELLTSFSMYLLPNYAPFNYIRFSERNATLLSYIKALGYSATALHSNEATNYSRHIAFPDMGFDRVSMGKGSFSEIGYYGNRHILDADDYEGLLSLYEQDPGEHRFYYLLTFQNHGGYQTNDSSLDTVHVVSDVGPAEDEVNEYLSSVALSAEAFRDLTRALSKVDRHVIVCMVGDHAPPFIRQLPAKREMSAEEQDLMMKCVPFVMWANYSIEFPEEPVNAAMTDLIPLLLSYARMPLTSFYQAVLDTHKAFPVRTSNGLCLDAAGDLSKYDETDPRYTPVTNYYFMEYNILADTDDYLAALDPKP